MIWNSIQNSIYLQRPYVGEVFGNEMRHGHFWWGWEISEKFTSMDSLQYFVFEGKQSNYKTKILS